MEDDKKYQSHNLTPIMKTEQCAKFKIDNRAILAEKAKTNAISRNTSRSGFLDSSVELSNDAYAL